MNWIDEFRYRWFNYCPSDKAIPIITKNNKNYYIFLDDDPPFQINVSQYGKSCGLMKVNWRDNEIELCEITIFKKYRRNGLGTAFLKWLISYARQKNVSMIWGIVAPQNGLDFTQVMNWYLNNGFQRKSPKSKVIVFDLRHND